MAELVSILIPAYNAERWLSETIRSALNQTWQHFEIIIVNDGSTDRTLSVAKAFESAWVKVVTQPNAGAPTARNRALELAQGTYIQWLDADDLLDRNKILAQMRVAHELSDPMALLSGAFGTFFYRPERAVFKASALWRDLTPAEYFLTRFNENVYLQTGAWLTSRQLADAAGRWTDVDSPNDDGEYFCRVVAKSTGVKFVPDARAYYRNGNYTSLRTRRSLIALTALYNSQVRCIDCLLAFEDSPRTRAAAVQLLQDGLHEYYPEHESIVSEANRLAVKLGGQLRRPTLKWKYRPIRWLFGINRTVMVSRMLQQSRLEALRSWDGFLYQLTHQGRARG